MGKGLKALKKIKQATYSIDFELSVCVGEDYKEEINIIEKELKALVVLKGLFDFDFALRFPSNQPMLRITNKRTNEYWEMTISEEEYDLFVESVALKYTYIHSATDQNLICVETHEIVAVELPPLNPIATYHERRIEAENEAKERYEKMKEELL